jgi:hypothetical protein
MTTKKHRTLRPSTAVAVATPSGAALAPVVIWALSAAGMPLPPDPATAAALGASLGSLMAGALAWIVKGGRRGEPD